jgi:hypothetical protein
MALQLWTSPVTGYRRIGTRVREIRAMFENDVTVRSIYEPLRACISSSDAAEMAQLLDERGFDVAGVKDVDGQAPITRFVTAEALRNGGIVDDHAVAIAAGDLLADATPLAKIFSILAIRQYSFVLADAVVAGIVTRADLNKPPARIYLFGLVSLIEMHLVFWIRREFGGTWKQHLTAPRIEAATKLFELRREKRQELDLCECLQICDKADLIVSQEKLRALFGIESKKTGRKTFARIQTLRDLLAHGQATLTEGGTWEDVINVVAWMEQALDKSDREVDNLASEAGANYVDKFWSPSVD